MARTTELTWRQYSTLLEQWSDRYLSGPTSLSIDGRPVCALLNLTDFAATYGTATFGIMLRYARVAIQRRVGREPYLLGLIGQVDSVSLALANALPIDAVTGYGLLPTWAGPPVQVYTALIRRRVQEWHWLQARLRRPFLPVVCAGWDASVRGEFLGQLRTGDRYPQAPIVVGTSPELFGEFLDEALAFNQRWHPELNVVFLHAWNEWSECSVLEPSDRLGDALLREVRARAGDGVEIVPGLLRSDSALATD
ncbi:glycoside hydrolase family 99-like domain-containing protein [Plantactinospora sp. WMMC1484]|uniref:glycoside hydrolase family 99-like domain-containing protein n=1 Tax=Plantactinospora sp. WMMC1484 TaxID=3404122 RepID=UPI003BF4BE36